LFFWLLASGYLLLASDFMRRSGILLHPTSLPGEWGIGDFGQWAYRFVDFLASAGLSLWQILPLGPPGCGNSPYQAYSSIAGNPLLISIEPLMERDWLSPRALQSIPRLPESNVDFDVVTPLKTKLLKKAARTFFTHKKDPLRPEFLEFCTRMKSWLDPYAEFMALKEANGGVAWTRWKPGVAANPREMQDHKFIQFEFFRQWKCLKRYCNEQGIEIIGDVPIFVAHDSSDVRSNPELFDLDEKGNPKTVAGVPPDYFSKTGQYWGNPLYRWDEMERTGYRWWIDRVKATLDMADIVRLDHFRGFEKFWEIPAGSATAVQGRWVKGPGDNLFQALFQALGRLPFIAEDLGSITPEVHQLRDRWGLPGMRVLQFAFGDNSTESPHRPSNFVRNCVAYTGTHDNDTTAGWFAAKTKQRQSERENALRYMGSDKSDPVWEFIRMLLASVAETVIIPMQDVLELGSDARMNIPATTANNWRWRMRSDQLKPELAQRLRETNRIFQRGIK
jgi:4-alpha-glucanotransferase